MIVGVPNVGKSSLINRMTGKKSAKTGDRPGVTKGKQWLTLTNGMQLLDTPGILWPKFEDPLVGLNLAFCGSIKDEILDVATLALELIKVLQKDYPQFLQERYKLDEIEEDGLANMENIAAKRGFLLQGKRIDYDRCGRTVLDEFRSGKIRQNYIGKGTERMTKAERQQMLEEKLQSMQEYERKLHAEGISYIAGVDEVGIGTPALAVVTACVVLPEDFSVLGVDDWKKTFRKEKRAALWPDQGTCRGLGNRHA